MNMQPVGRASQNDPATATPLYLAKVGMCFYLLLCVVSLARILVVTHGHFTYSLDDPYIHLALAENIAHLHYGLNIGEPASPSSSFLWPFLLVPFANTRWHEYLPLVLNLICGSAAAWLLGLLVAKLPTRTKSKSPKSVAGLVIVALLVILTNLVGLTFLGMEHTLQVLLAIACAYAMGRVLAGETIPWWCVLAAATGPLVRYENLSIMVVTAALLLCLRRGKTALFVVTVSTVPLLLFSLFLHHQGLPLLPTSVLVKAVGAAPEHSMLRTEVKTVLQTLKATVGDKTRWPVVLAFAFFAAVAWKQRNRARQLVFAGSALVAAAQVLVGHFGWFNRYEIYAFSFLTLIYLHLAAERDEVRSDAFVLVLFLLGSTSLWTAINTPRAAEDIYAQQAQMHRFTTDFYHGRVALNDLGLVSYRKPADMYVLDLVGLGSAESAKQQVKDAAWLQRITAQHGIALAMIYPSWFVSAPNQWDPLGKLCLVKPPVTASRQCVVFYSTAPEKKEEIVQALQKFVPTLPRDASFVFFANRQQYDSGLMVP